MYKPSEQGLNLLEILREPAQFTRRISSVCHRTFIVCEGYTDLDNRWVHRRVIGPYWPSNLVEALRRAGLIDHDGQITEEGKVAHLPPSSRSFNIKPDEADRNEIDEKPSNLKFAIAAYAWYFESCRKAGEQPQSFAVWRRVVTNEQIRDMVILYKLPV